MRKRVTIWGNVARIKDILWKNFLAETYHDMSAHTKNNKSKKRKKVARRGISRTTKPTQ